MNSKLIKIDLFSGRDRERVRELKREDERERKGRKNRATTFTPELVLPSKK